METPFELRAPILVTEGSEFEIACLVPPSYPWGGIRVALEAVASESKIRDSLRTTLRIQYAPCGTWLMTCRLSSGQYLERPIQVKGLCDG